ncbi:MAG: hypothetical protein AB7L71_01060 [Vicinamibacterales bacterium]
MTQRPLPPLPQAPAHSPEGEAVSLLLMTSLVLVVVQWQLAGSALLLTPALKLYAVEVLLVCAGGLVWRWSRSFPLAIVAVVVMLAFGAPLARLWLFAPLVIMALLFLRTLTWTSALRRVLAPRVLTGAVLATAAILTVEHYADFLLLDKLPFGDVHQDTLFHASVASMIKTYDIVSTGVHGLGPLAYHALTHRLVVGLSILTGVSVFEVFGVVATVVFGPFSIFAVSWASARLSSGVEGARVSVMWMVFCGIFVVLQWLPLERVALWDTYLFGDSSGLSIALLVCALPALASLDTKRVEMVVAVVLILLAGNAKGPVGMYGLAILWSRVLLMPGLPGRTSVAVVAAGATVAFGWTMAAAAEAGSAAILVNPFFYAQVHSQVFPRELREAIDAIRSFRVPEMGAAAKAAVSIGLYLAANLLFSWLVIGGAVIRHGWRSLFRQPSTLVVLTATAVSLAGMMIEIVGAWDLINPAMFIAMPFVLVGAGTVVDLRWPRWGGAVVAVMVATTAFHVLISDVRAGRGVSLKTQARMDVHRAYGHAPGGDFTTALRRLRDTVPASPPVVLMAGDGFVPRPDGFLYCTAAPFLYPALSERAWTGLLSPSGDCPYRYYGYPAYFTGAPATLAGVFLPPGGRVVTVPLSGADSR